MTSPPPAIAAALDLRNGDETVRIVRLRSAAATPLLLETSWIPRSRCPGLEHEDLERQSLYSLLELRYGHRPRAARQTIEATTASAFESELLSIAEGAPMLRLEGVTTTDRGMPIEWFQAIYRADRVKIAVESHAESQLGGSGGAADERDADLIVAARRGEGGTFRWWLRRLRRRATEARQARPDSRRRHRQRQRGAQKYIPHMQRMNIPRQRVDIAVVCDPTERQWDDAQGALRHSTRSPRTTAKFSPIPSIDLVLVLTSMQQHGEIAQGRARGRQARPGRKADGDDAAGGRRAGRAGARRSPGYLVCAPHVVLSPTYQAIWQRSAAGRHRQGLSRARLLRLVRTELGAVVLPDPAAGRCSTSASTT